MCYTDCSYSSKDYSNTITSTCPCICSHHTKLNYANPTKSLFNRSTSSFMLPGSSSPYCATFLVVTNQPRLRLRPPWTAQLHLVIIGVGCPVGHPPSHCALLLGSSSPYYATFLVATNQPRLRLRPPWIAQPHSLTVGASCPNRLM